MTLFGKKSKLESAVIARGAILSAQLDEQNVEIKKICELQRDTNFLIGQIRELGEAQLKSNREFVEVIRHFFAVEHKLKLEEIQRKVAKEKEFEETDADKKY